MLCHACPSGGLNDFCLVISLGVTEGKTSCLNFFFRFLEDFDIFWFHFEVSLNSVRYIPEGFSFYTDCRTFFDMISLGGGDWAFKFTTMVYHRV